MCKGLIQEGEGSIFSSTGRVDLCDISRIGGVCGAMSWAVFPAVEAAFSSSVLCVRSISCRHDCLCSYNQRPTGATQELNRGIVCV